MVNCHFFSLTNLIVAVLSAAKKTEKNMIRSSSLFANFDIVLPPGNASSSSAIKQKFALNDNNNDISRHYAPSSSYLVHVHYTDSQAVRSLSKPSSIINHQHHTRLNRKTSSILAKAK